MKNIRFAIAQFNPTVGDFSGNTRKILSWIQQAEKESADLIVFPELSLSGYPVWDLANKKSFVTAGLHHLTQIIRSTRHKQVTVILGVIDRGEAADGRSANTLVWIQKGRLLHKQVKRLLPTYDVFLEDIFFEPGKSSRIFPWKNRRVGSTICEDIWDHRYPVKPLEDLARQRANLIINISASPYYRTVAEVRERLLIRQTRQHHFPILYVNQVGGQDDLIFDGRSLLVDQNGEILFRAPAFREGLFFYDWNPKKKSPAIVSKTSYDSILETEEMYQALILGLRDYCRKNNFKKVVIGLSGGIDSALVATLAVDALGPSAVLGITMPGNYSSRGSWEDATDLAKRLGIKLRIYPIREKYQFLLKNYRAQKQKLKLKLPRKNKITLAMENLQARIRGLELMFVSNDEGRLLLTTGNKSELAMGYCTLYGDMAGGLSVIGDVYKTDVYRLAWYRNSLKSVIPESTLLKPPSAELRPDQKDEDSLPRYEILDEILSLYVEKNKSRDEIISLLKNKKVSARTVAEVICKVDHNEYKRRQTAPILRVTEKAWFGRRMPITNWFKH